MHARNSADSCCPKVRGIGRSEAGRTIVPTCFDLQLVILEGSRQSFKISDSEEDVYKGIGHNNR